MEGGAKYFKPPLRRDKAERPGLRKEGLCELRLKDPSFGAVRWGF